MYYSKFNKKIVSNLILGSSLYGIPASIITTMQATSTPPQGRQSARQYNKEATEQLEALLAKSETPLKECIKLVQYQNADPNVQVGLFTLLEEVVLTRSGLSVKPLIDKGANIHRVTGYKEVRNTDSVGRTLLHLAVYDPPRARRLLLQHKQEKEKLQGKPQERPTREEAEKIASENRLCNLPIDKYIEGIHSENELLAPEDKVVKELLDSGLDAETICMKETPNGDSVSGDAAYDLVNDNLNRLSNLKANSYLCQKIQKQYKKIKDLFDEKCGFYDKEQGFKQYGFYKEYKIRNWRIDQRKLKYSHAYPLLPDENRKDGSGPVDFSKVHQN